MKAERTIVYDRHELQWKAIAGEESGSNTIGGTWLSNKNTLDKWRHRRMYIKLQPIIDCAPAASWLTVGDGRFGTDAHALLGLGASTVHASDLSDVLLKVGVEKGFITDCSSQNAESLSFEDESFDFVLCKEAYHHFPRPGIAVHEMLRVCKVAVVLIEPRDEVIDSSPLSFLLPMARKIFGRPNDKKQHNFEPVGNYVFALSEREMEKTQLGMHRTLIAFSGLNDYYQSGVEFIDMQSKDLSDRLIILKTKFLIGIRDMLNRLGLLKTSILTVIMFKTQPDDSLIEAIRGQGWEVRTLPENPFLDQ